MKAELAGEPDIVFHGAQVPADVEGGPEAAKLVVNGPRRGVLTALAGPCGKGHRNLPDPDIDNRNEKWHL